MLVSSATNAKSAGARLRPRTAAIAKDTRRRPACAAASTAWLLMTGFMPGAYLPGSGTNNIIPARITSRTSMTDAASSATRLLFVIDNDFGALGVVMYMLHRQPLAARALILLPRRAYEQHGRALPVACKPYESLADILAAVEAHSPDVACLYSGYLLAAQRLLGVG